MLLLLQEELAATYQALQVAEARAAELAAGLEADRAAATAAADDKVSTAKWSHLQSYACVGLISKHGLQSTCMCVRAMFVTVSTITHYCAGIPHQRARLLRLAKQRFFVLRVYKSMLRTHQLNNGAG